MKCKVFDNGTKEDESSRFCAKAKNDGYWYEGFGKTKKEALKDLRKDLLGEEKDLLRQLKTVRTCLADIAKAVAKK